MKKILITGKNSYIGTSVKNWLLKTPDLYEVDTIDLRNPEWVNEDFSKYDVVLHTAGVAHIKETKKNRELYFKVNRDLAFNIALKSKESGIGHFIFLSSMSVYGIETGVINIDTKTRPKTAYGKSKLAAEKMIWSLQNNDFIVAIIRPPMIYGKGSKGNYSKLSKLARYLPIFPKYENRRSVLYIENLCEFIRITITFNYSGVLFPQNKEYISTTNLYKQICNVNGSKVYLTKRFNFLIVLFIKISIINKLFGDLVYDYQLSIYNQEYQIVDFEKSIELTER